VYEAVVIAINCQPWFAAGVQKVGAKAQEKIYHHLESKGKWPVFLVLLLLAAPIEAPAQFTYSNNGGALTITDYYGPGGAVTIPTNIDGMTVTSIGYGAFKFSASLTSITIPGSVTSIGDVAFYECSSLASVTIPDSVSSIGNIAFFGCTNMPSVTIPNSVTSIGDSAFADCTSLTAITVDAQNSFYSDLNGVLFDESESLLIQYPSGLGGNYTVPLSVTNIGEEAFYYCTSLTSATIPASVTSIGEAAFFNCTGLTSVTILGSVTSIGYGTFYFCTNMTNVTIPVSVTNIGQAAFEQCYGLTRFTIPGSVTTIGDNAFADCTSLTSVTIPGSVTSIGEQAFYNSGLTNVTIPDSVTSIGEEAFAQTELASVTIPGSVTSIGDYAFAFCSSLSSVFFTGNAPGADSSVFVNDNNPTVYYLPGTSGWSSTFSGRPAVLWLPQMQNVGVGLGVGANGFEFNIFWADGLTVVVEACTNLANPVWQPLQTNTLTNGMFYFSDPQWTNYPDRYYRISAP
jgi:hypothetical protein